MINRVPLGLGEGWITMLADKPIIRAVVPPRCQSSRTLMGKL